MATLNKDRVQLSLSIGGKEAENTMDGMIKKAETLQRQLFELEEQGKKNGTEWKKIDKERKQALDTANKQHAAIKRAQEQQAKFQVNEGKSLKRLQAEYRQLRAIMANLPENHKDFNKQLNLMLAKKARIDSMRKTFRGIKDEVKGMNRNLVDVGDLVTGGLITGGILGMAELLGTGANAVADIVENTAQLRREITQLTGAGGQELDEITVKVAALGATFEKDTTEILRAANAASREFGVTTTAALDQIELGLLSGADISGEFLDNIREYAVQGAAANVTLEEFVGLNIKASQEGVFSDKGLDVVKEFGLRIREQTTATSAAMEAAFGREFTDEIFGGINDGSVTTVQALQRVAAQMDANKIPANQLQTVIADVFGGPGEDAGLRYLQSLKDIKGETEGLLDTTDEYVVMQQMLQEANEEVARSQNELTQQLEGSSNSLDLFIANAKSFAIDALVTVIDFFRRFSAVQVGVAAGVKQFFVNTSATIEGFVIDLGIKYNQIRKLNPFGETDARIDQDIAALQSRKDELAENARTVGEAYREAYLAGLKLDEIREATASPSAPRPSGGRPTSTPTSTPGASASTTTTTSGSGEIEALQTLENQKLEIQEESNARALELLDQEMNRFAAVEEMKREQMQETAEKKNMLERAIMDIAKDSLQVTIDVLSKDEAARKKNAKAIKAFKTAQVFTNLFEEVSGIWRNANSNALNTIIPGWGIAFATAQTALASTRAQLNVSKIQSQKYEKGGVAQGARHSEGGVKLVDSGSGQVVGEMEGGEPYMILSRDTYGNNKGVIDALLDSSMNRGGAPIFESGGIFQASRAGATAGGSSNLEGLTRDLLTEQRMMRQAIARIPTTLRAEVALGEVNDSNDMLDEIRAAASI